MKKERDDTIFSFLGSAVGRQEKVRRVERGEGSRQEGLGSELFRSASRMKGIS